jgi:hypothetical protein
MSVARAIAAGATAFGGATALGLAVLKTIHTVLRSTPRQPAG